jgi:hypothetical protein
MSTYLEVPFDVAVYGKRGVNDVQQKMGSRSSRKNQTPGLSARKRMVADPPGGTISVSRRIGFGFVSLIGIPVLAS